jgi:hypothetical protein
MLSGIWAGVVTKQKSEGGMILTIHPHRQRDEILSSWMLRIASGNIVSVFDLCKCLNIPYELDSFKPDHPVIDSLAEAFGVQREVIIQALPSSLTDWIDHGVC